MIIRPVREEDAPALGALYNHYILNTTVTFEEVPLDDAEMLRRLRAVTPEYPWLVAERDGAVAGYAYAHAYHERSAFRFTAEVSIYLHPDHTGQGVGRALYAFLLARLDEQGIHRLVAAIALPNPASVALHEKFGFQPAGVLGETGFKFGQWVDVGYWVRANAETATDAG